MARQFGILRESVWKMLQFSVPSGCRRTASVCRPKFDRFTEFIDQWLEEDRKRPRKQRKRAAMPPLSEDCLSSQA